MYLIGKTGMGKSTILENMIVDDIRAGHGVAVVDPHGDLAEKIIEYIPSNRINDVVYFNPADINFPIAFNVVEQVEPHLRHLVASGLIGVFQKLWADSWGPRLEYILRNAILAILDFPGSTLLGVVRMLSDKNYRKRVVSNIKDPVVKAFWEKEFSSYADKFASEAVSPIQNKVGQFLSNSLMRNIVGQVKSSIDIRDIMDNGKILIMNLSKGRIGEDNSALLGAMMITKIQLAAMSRVDVPEKERRDFYLYIDEFQNLILAHQYIEQLSEKVKPAVFGNVGTMVVFRVGAADAEELVKEFTPTFTEEDLVNLPKYEMYLKLMIDGIASSPFSAMGLPPLKEEEQTNNTEKVINYSREKYASNREEVEAKIMSWHENSGEDEVRAPVVHRVVPGVAPVMPEASAAATKTTVSAPVPVTRSAAAVSASAPAQRPAVVRPTAPTAAAKPGYPAVCANCGKETTTIFKPDGIRPVYCRDCLSKKKEEKRLATESRLAAKKEEIKQLAAKTTVPTPTPSISLTDLNKLTPRDFRGRELPAKPASAQPANSPAPEQDLLEGQEITVVNNNY
jgi:CxxC-x17-CxxC domain-containing protein